eukprot:2069598-Karenia_brevis.AAC.1
MDRSLAHYTNQMDASTNNTRHEVVEPLENIVGVVREHDDRLDSMRSTREPLLLLQEKERELLIQ